MTDDLLERVSRLPAQQRKELLDRLRSARRLASAAQAESAALRPRDPGVTDVPLSPAQERLYVSDRLDPGNPAYNIALTLRIRGLLDAGALERALNAVVARHEALRTVFMDTPDGPRQRVLPPVRITIRPVMRAESELAEELGRHARTRLNLAAGPVLDARLFTLTGDDHVLQVTVHHIAFDGWSSALFTDELVGHYRALTGQAPYAPPPLTVQYPDFALWTRRRTAGEPFAERLRRVCDRLTGAPVALHLPADRPRPPVASHRGGHLRFAFEPDTAERLGRLARTEGTTLYTALLSAFSVLLSQAAGTGELVIGTPAAGRTRAELEPMIGCFADILLVRIAPRAAGTFRELLHRAHGVVRQAYDDQEVPYAKVVEALAPPRDPSRNPLFQVMFGYADLEPASRDDLAPAFTAESHDTGASDFDLFLSMSTRDGILEGEIGFDSGLFDARSVADLVERYRELTAELVGAPDVAWSQIPLLRGGTIAVAATYTADPVGQPLTSWARYLGLPTAVQLASYGQVVQQLLDDNGVFSRNSSGINVVLLRWEDFLRNFTDRSEAGHAAARALLEDSLADLCEAVTRYCSRSVTPLSIFLCPPSAAWARQPWTALFARLQERLAHRLAGHPAVSVSSVQPGSWPFPASGFHDERSDRLAAIPYTKPFFAALGTSIARRYWAQARLLGLRPLLPSRIARIDEDPADLDALFEEIARPPLAIGAAPDALTPYQEPRTHTERRLAELWRQALGAGRVGRTDNFFALGGHSLLAVGLLSRVEAEFGCSIELSELFVGPTIEQLAAVVDAGGATTGGPVPVPRDGTLPVSSTQRRLWMLAKVHGADARHNMAFSARLHGELDEDSLRSAVAGLLARHEVLRTTIIDHGGEPVLRILPLSDDLTALVFPGTAAAGQTELRARLDGAAAAPFDLAEGPLIRIRLFRAGPREHHLSVVMHHAVADDRSWMIFLSELSVLYAAVTSGSSPALPGLPLQFADYAHWQCCWLKREAAALEQRWRDLLSDAPPLSLLPTDLPRTGESAPDCGRVVLRIGAELTSRLRATARTLEVPLFSVLLAGYQLLAQHLTDQDTFVVGVPVANRDDQRLASVMGDFADLVPVRLTLSAGLPVRALVGGVHRAVLSSRTLQRLPFENIVSALRTTRRPHHHPLFQTVVNFVDADGEPPRLAGLTVTPDQTPPGGTDFELFLSVNSEAGELLCTLDYAAGLYTPAGASALLEALRSRWEALCGPPDGPAAVPATSARLPALRPPRAPGKPKGDRPETGRHVAIAASFTAEPVAGSVGFWLAEFGLEHRVAFAPYGQVMQQLLDPAGTLGVSGSQVNAVLLRWEDWVRHSGQDPAARPDRVIQELERGLASLCKALATYRSWSAVPLLVAVCPASPQWHVAPWAAVHSGLLERLTRFAARAEGIRVVNVRHATRSYPVGSWHDQRADELGHIPYTAEFFTVLGTALARAVVEARAECRSLYLEPLRLLGSSERGTASHGRDAVIVRAVRQLGMAAGRHVLFGGAGQDAHARILPAASQVTWGPDEGTGPEDRFARAVARGDVDPATCVFLDPDAGVCSRVRTRYPELLAITVPPAAAATQQLLDHIWALGPSIGDCGTTYPRTCLRILADLTDAQAVHAAVAAYDRAAGDREDAAAARPYVAPRDETERLIAQIFGRLLAADRVGVTDSFLDLGGDSMTAILAVSQAARHGITLTPRQLLRSGSVGELAAARGTAPGPAARQAPVSGPVPLTAAQHWFFDQPAREMVRPGHFNHPYYLTVRPGITPDQLERGLRRLVDHHDTLRSRFTSDDRGGWTQRIEPPGVEIPFERADLSGLPPAERETAAENLAAVAQRGLDLESGPLVRALHLRFGDEPDRLLIVNHHLVVDAISRGILLEDLSMLCEQADNTLTLPPKTTSYREWADGLIHHARSGELRAESSFWLGQLADGPDVSVPLDHSFGTAGYGTAATVTARLGTEQTTRLHRLASRTLRTYLAALLLGVTSAVLAEWTSASACRIAVAGHGRQDVVPGVDLSRTVGWFQIYYPLTLAVPGDDDLDVVRAVVGQLDQVPGNGIGFPVLRYLSPDRELRKQLAAGHQPQVSFNYMGEFSFEQTSAHTSLFGPCPQSYGPAQDGTGCWPYVLDVVPSVVEGRLHVDVNYNRNTHRTETAQAFARRITARLAALADRGQPPDQETA